MLNDAITRRRFVRDLALAGGALLGSSGAVGAADRGKRRKLHVACNSYSWLVFYRRENRNLNAELDAALGGGEQDEGVVIDEQQPRLFGRHRLPL